MHVVVAQLSREEIYRRASRGTAAGAVIIDAQQRVLLVKRSYGPLNWEIPSGAAELDETPTQTALREVCEETALAVIAESLSGIYYERKADPGQAYEDRSRAQADRQLRQSEARPVPSVRTCTECGLVKVVAEFTPIKGRTANWYGRCRVCRARRARERYWASPDERERQKARVRRNRQRRKGAGTTST